VTDTRHAAIPQPGCNVCVCGELTTNADVHNRIGSAPPTLTDALTLLRNALPADPDSSMTRQQALRHNR